MQLKKTAAFASCTGDRGRYPVMLTNCHSSNARHEVTGVSVGDDHYKGFNSVTAICLKPVLYLRYRVDDLNTPFH